MTITHLYDAPSDTRLACGNITMVQAFSASGSSNSSSSGSAGGKSGALPSASAAGALAASLALVLGTAMCML
jgi:hypothetical protein